MRRPLFETLTDLAVGFQPAGDADEFLRVTECFIDAPIEVRLYHRDGELELLADLPGWRWQHGFAEHPGRLRIAWTQSIET